ERRQEERGLPLQHAATLVAGQSLSRRNPVSVVVSPPRDASRTNASSFWISSRSSAESAPPVRPSTTGSRPSTSTYRKPPVRSPSPTASAARSNASLESSLSPSAAKS